MGIPYSGALATTFLAATGISYGFDFVPSHDPLVKLAASCAKLFERVGVEVTLEQLEHAELFGFRFIQLQPRRTISSGQHMI